MRSFDFVRYGIWAGIVATAAGNRRQYNMSTTWLPHLVSNSLSLLLPDVLRLLPRPHSSRTATLSGEAWEILRRTLDTMVRDNPRYVAYVAPFAAGYLLSAPWFNIYKGELGDMELAGFGWDALPHSATAAGITLLVADALQVAAKVGGSAGGALVEPLEWAAEHHALVSGVALTLATIMWEIGEYRIYQHERGIHGSDSKINMQWSMDDTLHDAASNALGWALALWWRDHGA